MSLHSAGILPRVVRRLLITATSLYAIGLLVYVAGGHLLSNYWWYALLANFAPLYFVPLVFLLPLMLYWRARIGIVLLLPLSLYAAFSFGAFFIPHPQTAASTGTMLSVVTFNVSDRNRQPERLIPWLLEQQADVVLLQEISLDWVNRGISELRDQYPYQIGHRILPENKGAIILSRFPLGDVDENTSFFRTVIAMNDQSLALYNVSLPAPMRSRPREPLQAVNPVVNPLWDMAWGYDEEARNHQLDLLLAQIEAEDLPTVVAGDFNLSEFTPGYRLWSERLTDSFREAGIGFGTTWPVFERYGLPSVLPPLVRLDYIWHTSSLRAISTTIGSYLGSDHLPVSATIQF